MLRFELNLLQFLAATNEVHGTRRSLQKPIDAEMQGSLRETKRLGLQAPISSHRIDQPPLTLPSTHKHFALCPLPNLAVDIRT